jgi:hypothetical protein
LGSCRAVELLAGRSELRARTGHYGSDRETSVSAAQAERDRQDYLNRRYGEFIRKR